MNGLDIIRAWKDEAYRLSLTEAERAALPQNPAGLVAMSEDRLRLAGGAPKHRKAGPSAIPAQCNKNTLLCPTIRPLCPVDTRVPCGPGPGTLYCTKVVCPR